MNKNKIKSEQTENKWNKLKLVSDIYSSNDFAISLSLSYASIAEASSPKRAKANAEPKRKSKMESSEEDDDFPSIESITPQSKVDSLYQSHTEKVSSSSLHNPLFGSR